MDWKDRLFGKNSGLLNPMSNSPFAIVLYSILIGYIIVKLAVRYL